MPRAYYNENDKGAAEWIRQLIHLGEIAPGDVDDRSIEDVTINDLKGYTQCHFFAGIGVWSYALRQAGWPDSRPAWSGSAPCQGFSSAGKQKGFDDERHLWPIFYELIRGCMPPVCFGEQVSGKLVTGPFLSAKEAKEFERLVEETGHYPEEEDPNFWLPLVQSDLEREGYAVGSVVTGACAFGAPHQRKRLYWVGSMGHLSGAGLPERRGSPVLESGAEQQFERSSPFGKLGNSYSEYTRGNTGASPGAEGGSPLRPIGDMPTTSGAAGTLGEPEGQRDTRINREPFGPQSTDDGATRGKGGNGEASVGASPAGELADLQSKRLEGGGGQNSGWSAEGVRARRHGHRSSSIPSQLAHNISSGPQGRLRGGEDPEREDIDGHVGRGSTIGGPREVNGFWRAADWIYCRDEKWRPVKPGSFPLVDGSPSELVQSCDLSTPDVEFTKEARVMRLKGYGNAIVSEQAIAFIEAYLETEEQ